MPQCTVKAVYAGERFPDAFERSLFLAGPSPRDPCDADTHRYWRLEALQSLRDRGYEGVVYVPLPRDRQCGGDFDLDAQASWEQDAMARSDVILFWVPRDLATLPGFTTNVEFGLHVKGRKVVLGHPEGAPKTRYLDWLADCNYVERVTSLEDAVEVALRLVGEGALREGGECQVPLYLWRTKTFAQWMQAQKAAGNRLDGCSVELTFGVGPRKAFLLYWAAHVDLYVAAEGRNKTNELVVSRPDIMHVVAYWRAPNLLESEIVLVREFRSTASIGDCMVREVPGGSSAKNDSPEQAAADELFEEAGFRPDPARVHLLCVRQVAATTTAHRAHVYAVEMTEEEWTQMRDKAHANARHGNEEESEQTFVEIHTLRELLGNPTTDWANLGMVAHALFQDP